MMVYVSGPMTGYPDYNREAFRKAAADLKAKGFGCVITPLEDAELYLSGNLTMPELIGSNLNNVASSDAIYLLKGWQNSQGAKRELQTAIMLGKEILVE